LRAEREGCQQQDSQANQRNDGPDPTARERPFFGIGTSSITLEIEQIVEQIDARAA
jgi:hypothetical protein